MAESLPGDPNAVMISINEPGCEPARLMAGFAAVLRTAFWDVAVDQPVMEEGVFPFKSPKDAEGMEKPRTVEVSLW